MTPLKPHPSASLEFPFLTTRSFLRQARRHDPRDPILAQIIPSSKELAKHVGFSRDPLRETRAHLTPNLLHKYRGRALLLVTDSCAVHCRFCFRRHTRRAVTIRRLADSLRAIRRDKTISEVILSGGDPLMLSPFHLRKIIKQLSAIPHVQLLRIHTRIPVVSPSRITRTLLQSITGSRLRPIMVIHCNHPREIYSTVKGALRRIARAGIILLNQSVLLRGINDSPVVLSRLSRLLIQYGVVPYYLHQLDPVAGSAHFQVPVARGRRILNILKETLPGYLVPRYVQEKPGAKFKTLL